MVNYGQFLEGSLQLSYMGELTEANVRPDIQRTRVNGGEDALALVAYDEVLYHDVGIVCDCFEEILEVIGLVTSSVVVAGKAEQATHPADPVLPFEFFAGLIEGMRLPSHVDLYRVLVPLWCRGCST